PKQGSRDMNQVLDFVSNFLLVSGAVFFLAGSVGLLRFRDVHSRLHALSKADNLGLGFMALGLAIRAENVASALKILLIWLLALLASAVSCFIIAEWEARHG